MTEPVQNPSDNSPTLPNLAAPLSPPFTPIDGQTEPVIQETPIINQPTPTPNSSLPPLTNNFPANPQPMNNPGIPNNQAVTDQFPAGPAAIPPPKEQSGLKNKKKSGINFLMLVLGPLFMVGALSFSYLNYKNLPVSLPQTNKQGGVSQEKLAGQMLGEILAETDKEAMRQTLLNVPKNPTEVSATCQSTGGKLESAVPTDCPDPLFSWSGEQTQESGTKITGFYVYFGTNGDDQPITPNSPVNLFQKVIRPKHDGNFQPKNKFSPKNLEKGTIYYLAVAAVSDSTNPNWQTGLDIVSVDDLSARSAKILFVYDYQ